jgi:hypothetical protein
MHRGGMRGQVQFFRRGQAINPPVALAKGNGAFPPDEKATGSALSLRHFVDAVHRTVTFFPKKQTGVVTS